MPRPKNDPRALSPGQLARRWEIGVDRAQALLRDDRATEPFWFLLPVRCGATTIVLLAMIVIRSLAPARQHGLEGNARELGHPHPDTFREASDFAYR
jgi:hypothetical protein